MSDLGTVLAIAVVGVGGYALYRWLNPDHEPGHWRRKEKQNLHDAHVGGYFAGVQSGPAIVGAGPTTDYAGHYGSHFGYYAGDGRAPPPPPPPDPRNCLCPMSLDPLDPQLPVYKCPCNVPGAIRPPYAGYMATERVGRGGGRGGFRRRQQQQQQQRQDDGSGEGGEGGEGMPGGQGMPGAYGGMGMPGGGPAPQGMGMMGHPGMMGMGRGHPSFGHPQHFGRR